MTDAVGRVALPAATPGFDSKWVLIGVPVALVVWLASPSATVNGRVFNVRAGHVSVAEGWRPGPAYEKEGPFDVAELDRVVPGLVEAAAPQVDAYNNAKAYGDA